MMLSESLYTILANNKDSFLIVLSDETHPVFKAHFESNPILPGFLQIDMISEMFGLEITEIKKAKYFEIVRPLEKLNITAVKRQDQKMYFEITKEDSTIISKIELIINETN